MSDKLNEYFVELDGLVTGADMTAYVGDHVGDFVDYGDMTTYVDARVSEIILSDNTGISKVYVDDRDTTIFMDSTSYTDYRVSMHDSTADHSSLLFINALFGGMGT